MDDKDDLVLKEEITLPGSHTVTELSEITKDYKYDPASFRIPVGFRIDTSESKPLPPQR